MTRFDVMEQKSAIPFLDPPEEVRTPPFSRWDQKFHADHQVDGESYMIKFRIGLTRLSEDERAVFVLRDLNGMNTSDVARVLRTTHELVRKRLYQARLSLRGTLRNLVVQDVMT